MPLARQLHQRHERAAPYGEFDVRHPSPVCDRCAPPPSPVLMTHGL